MEIINGGVILKRLFDKRYIKLKSLFGQLVLERNGAFFMPTPPAGVSATVLSRELFQFFAMALPCLLISSAAPN